MPLIYDNDILETAFAKKINNAAVEQLCNLSEIKHYPKRSIIKRSGEITDSLLYLIKGSVYVTILNENNKEVMLDYLNTGSFIGEIGMFYQLKHCMANVRARSHCEVAEIKYERLQELFQNKLRHVESDILRAVDLQLTQRLLKVTQRVTHLASVDVSGRVARILLDLCREPQAMSHPDGTQIHISRREIGSIAGCSRETVGRILQKMEEDGMIAVYGMDIVVYHSR